MCDWWNLLQTNLAIHPPTPQSLCNISLCYLKLSEFESAVQYASEAISLDPLFNGGKPLFRRACALASLLKYPQAIADIERLLSLLPASPPPDPIFHQKIALWRKEFFQANFAKALAIPRLELTEASIAKLPDDLAAESGAPPLSDPLGVTQWLAEGRLLSRKQFLRLCLQVKGVLEKEKTFQFVSSPEERVQIVGDLHGQFDDLLRIFRQAGYPSERVFMFNGDWVDRGKKSVEILTVLFVWKIAYPERVWLNRGNHEFESICSVYGFAREMHEKYDDQVFALVCRQVFPLLPIGHVIDKRVFVVHGGLIDPGHEHFSNLGWWAEWPRSQFASTEGVGEMSSWLWSDPGVDPGIRASHRGSGWIFGPDVTDRFCRDTGVALVVRSHEFVPGGVDVKHGGKCVTIFSASNYQGEASGAAYLDLCVADASYLVVGIKV